MRLPQNDGCRLPVPAIARHTVNSDRFQIRPRAGDEPVYSAASAGDWVDFWGDRIQGRGVWFGCAVFVYGSAFAIAEDDLRVRRAGGVESCCDFTDGLGRARRKREERPLAFLILFLRCDELQERPRRGKCEVS